MQFGRVDGFVIRKRTGQRWVSVVLDTGIEIETLRYERVPEAFEDSDAAGLARQMAEEAIGNELDVDGWEVVGEGDTRHEPHRMLNVVARTQTWVIQRNESR